MGSKIVPSSEMTIEKQLERAYEIYPDSKESLQDMRVSANAEETRYILYGIKDDEF